MCIINANVNNKYLSLHLFFLSVAMGIIGFYISSSDSGPDLVRHWQEWHVVNGDKGEVVRAARIAKIASNGLLLWDGFLLLSTYLGDVHFLAGIITLFNYIFFWRSCVLVCKNYNSSFRELAIYLVIKIGLVSWFNMFAGLRNVFAFSAAGYAILLDCYHKKKSDWIKIIFALLCSVLTHLAGYFVVIFLLLRRIIKTNIIKKFLIICLCLWSCFVFLISKIFSLLPFEIFAFMGQKLIRYYGFSADAALIPWFTCVCIIFFIILGCHLLYINSQKKKINYMSSKESNIFFDYMEIMESFVIGSILMPTVIMRMIYLFGFTLYPLIIESKIIKCKRHFYLFILTEFALCSLMAAYNFRGIQSHMFLENLDYSFLQNWSFL